jgi:hypothetical protein
LEVLVLLREVGIVGRLHGVAALGSLRVRCSRC